LAQLSLLRRSIALRHLLASAPEERNVTRKPTCRSYGAGSSTDRLVYKHPAPPEQRQASAKTGERKDKVSQVCDCRFNGFCAARDNSLKFHGIRTTEHWEPSPARSMSSRKKSKLLKRFLHSNYCR